MPLDEEKMQCLQALRSQFSQALKDFASSSSSFRVLRSIPGTHAPSSAPVSTLFVLDSSFNPPSKAHSSLVKSALSSSIPTRRSNSESLDSQTSHAPQRVLFLLATVNADKKPKPADFEDRLVMMTLMAEDLRGRLSSQESSQQSQSQQEPAAANLPVIDIGITKEPYFTDKATSITQSNIYTPSSPNSDDAVGQVHITGFDTLTRIFTSRYYPNSDPPLAALEPFLSRHRIHTTIRVESSSANDDGQEDEFGTVEKQQGYLEGLANGGLEREGLKREWVDQVHLAVDESGEADGVSSTRARECVQGGKFGELGQYVCEGVKDWIVQRGLYRD